jgi:malate/lactate dehydrogenase
MRVTSVVVLGAGELGGAIASAVAGRGAAHRVTLVDDAAEVARGLALDIRQCGPVLGAETAVIGSADLAAVVGAAAVIVADRHVTRADWSGEEGLQLLARVRALNPGALVICAGATQLALVERAVLEQGADRRRLFGSAPEALRAAIVALTGLEAGCRPGDISLAVLGRPPHQVFVPWTAAAINGERATDVLDPPALQRLDHRLARMWPPGPITLAAAASRVVGMALAGAVGGAYLFAVPERTAEQPTRGAALPASFSRGGVRVAVPALSVRDRVRLETALGV